MRVNYICRLSLLQHRATATLKSMNPHTFSSYTHCTIHHLLPKAGCLCFAQKKPLLPHHMQTSNHGKFIVNAGLNQIPNPIYRKYRRSNTDTQISVHMSTEDTDTDNTAVILKGYPIRHQISYRPSPTDMIDSQLVDSN